MRITLLTDGIHPYVVGGIQRHSRMLAEHLALAGVDVTVFHTARRGASVAHARALEGLPLDPWTRTHVEFVEYPREARFPGHYLLDSWRYSTALLERFRTSGTPSDFVYAQGLTGLAFVNARRRDPTLPPVGVNVHGYPMFQPTYGIRARLEQAMLRPTFRRLTQRADYVFTFSGKVRDIVERTLRVPAHRILEVPNGIADEWIAGATRPTAATRRFIFIGRHDPSKGLPELAIAFSSMSSSRVMLDVVGPVPVPQQAQTPRIAYHGPITDAASLQNLLDTADVLVCPSRAEGMPTVILEAMARGLAVIATDVGATSELVDSDNGILLPRVDVSQLRDALRSLTDATPESLDRMKMASLRKVARYRWSNVADATIAAIRSVLSVGADARPAGA